LCIASLVQVAQSLTNCNRPSSSEHHSVRNFINYRQPLVPSEQKFIYCKEDLITLRPGREHAWLDSSMEKVLKWMRCDLIEVSFFNTSSPSMTLTNFVVYILFKSKRPSQRYGRFDFNESNKDKTEDRRRSSLLYPGAHRSSCGNNHYLHDSSSPCSSSISVIARHDWS
jgi:hypothetical protein